jgi:hypothetical protein
LQLTDIAASILQSIYIVASILQLIDIAMSKPTSQATQQQPRQAQSDSEKDSNNMMVIESSSQVDGNFKVPREGFKQCDRNLNGVPRWMAILKPLEKDSNNVTAI